MSYFNYLDILPVYNVFHDIRLKHLHPGKSADIAQHAALSTNPHTTATDNHYINTVMLPVYREMAKIDNSVHQHQMRQWMGRWKCRTGKCGTNDVKFEGTKMQHWKMRDWNAGLENGVRQWVMSSRSASYFTTEQRRRHWQTRYNVKVNVENISCDRNVRSQRTGSTWRDGVAFMPCGHARFCSACAETVTRVRNGCQLVPHGFTSILLRLKRVQSFFYLNHCHNYFWLLLELTWNVTACMKLNHCRNYVLAVFKNACSTSRN